MGLGGHLTWTAAIREIHKEHSIKVLPCEFDGAGNYVKPIESEIFLNNPYCAKDNSEEVFFLPMNIPETNYCKADYPDRVIHRPDRHIIEQICEYYGIMNPDLKCDLFFSDEEMVNTVKLLDSLGDDFLVIEPYSKTNYTPNRVYPFEKWQNIVDELSKHIEIVQVGNDENYLLNGVTNLIGKTTFREAACLIGYSHLLMSTESGLVHAATSVGTTALSIVTGYQDPRMVNYPQNINVYIGTHGPCGQKIPCIECRRDAENHDEYKIVNIVWEYMNESGIC